jgi:beta-N-acetylhexosaminidase
MNFSSFSDQELAGQRMMVGFDGTGLTDDLKFLIDALSVGGLILFARNLGSPDEIANLCGSAQEYAATCGKPPLLMAMDQEGGQVARLRTPFTVFPGNPFLTDEAGVDRFAAITAKELLQIGVNMNMVPVLDVAAGVENSIMAERVFPGGPETVARLGGRMIDRLQEKGVMSVAKHFPGIGRTTNDSHIDQPELGADLALLETSDLVPFRAAIDYNVAGVMLSHICYTGIDPTLPASLSVPVVKDLLRDTMGYDGVVMTDDLDMGAIAKHYAIETSLQHLFAADVDIALICHAGPDIQRAYDELLRLTAASDEGRAATLQSVNRIMRLKEKFLITTYFRGTLA